VNVKEANPRSELRIGENEKMKLKESS